MAEGTKKAPVKKTIVRVDGGESRATVPAKKGKATGHRIGAAVCWALAIVVEAAVIALVSGLFYLPGDPMWYIIGGIVLDLIFVVIGSLLWKKSNDIDPPSEKNKLKFFLWNNLGLIMAVVAFLPLVIIIFTNKKLDPKTKRITGVIAAIALAVAGLVSYDWNPVSAEQAAGLESTLQGQTVYWTPFGAKFHTDVNCSTLSRSSTVYEGSITEAIEANRNSPCSVCSDALIEAGY